MSVREATMKESAGRFVRRQRLRLFAQIQFRSQNRCQALVNIIDQAAHQVASYHGSAGAEFTQMR